MLLSNLNYLSVRHFEQWQLLVHTLKMGQKFITKIILIYLKRISRRKGLVIDMSHPAKQYSQEMINETKSTKYQLTHYNTQKCKC